MGSAYGRYLEGFQAGEMIKHEPAKTITESDNNLFCLLTMNHHPLHLDQTYAEGTEFGRRVVVGTLVFSLVVGLTVRDISGKAIANLDYESIQHAAPVFIGDTIRAETEILNVRRSRSKPDRGIVRVQTSAYNQKNQLVLTFIRNVLIPVGVSSE
ncbi:MAG: MaoC family dehydratase [Candidatus Cloacimonetes bacterium]|nr:MaoC family dehydratase [Candidatus Cloacimonadota bacterium]